jgi:hypothetical protein
MRLSRSKLTMRKIHRPGKVGPSSIFQQWSSDRHSLSTDKESDDNAKSTAETSRDHDQDNNTRPFPISFAALSQFMFTYIRSKATTADDFDIKDWPVQY